MIGGGWSLVPEILGQTDPVPSKTTIFNRFSPAAPHTWHLAKKSPISTNMKSTMRFPMSLRWTAHVASKPTEECSKKQNGRFPSKSAFLSKKVCYKVSLCENRQRQSCKAFVGLFIPAKIVGGRRPLLHKKLTESDPPHQKRRFLINNRS